jgi:transposase
MAEKRCLPEWIKISDEDLNNTPPAVTEVLFSLAKRLEKLEAKLARNSSNSNKPSSTDDPYKEKPIKKNRPKKGKKPRKGFRQKLLPATETKDLLPEACSCGCAEITDTASYYTHQRIELPEIEMDVTHFVLHKGQCAECGKTIKAKLPERYLPGFGPRLSALIAQIAGIEGNSRETIQSFCSSVLKIPISLGGIQKIIDRASESIEPHYGAIRDKARSCEVNHLDETTWKKNGKLNWLWIMANTCVAYFMIHTNRSQAAFEELIGSWSGILVSDGYKIYQKWVGLRQTCLAHLIRRAEGLSERKDPELEKCGKWALKELRLLCHWANAPPTIGEWNAFYARLCRLIALYRGSESDAGRFVRHLEMEMDDMWTFLIAEGVEPTNNFGERIIRFAVLWRKRSQGTRSEKGNRWVERILSLRQTCRLQNKSSFDVLVDALACHFEGRSPDLDWIKKAI